MFEWLALKNSDCGGRWFEIGEGQDSFSILLERMQTTKSPIYLFTRQIQTAKTLIVLLIILEL